MNNIKNKIVFLRPPIFEGDPRYAPILESLGIEYLVGHCRSNGIECIYIDANLQELSTQEVCQQLLKIKPSMLFITITTEKIRNQTEEILNFVEYIRFRRDV